MSARLVAALPMYDFASTASAQDALWSAMAASLRAEGIEAPSRLTRGRPVADLWQDSGLLFGQTCGYPMLTWLDGALAGLATPAYRFDGCEGASHVSFIVARADDERMRLVEFRGARAAVNAPDSDTGMNLFRRSVAAIAGGDRFFSSVLTTGAHVRSLAAVAAAQADLAAIDCVSFALIRAERPAFVDSFKIVERTAASPNLPFVASASLSAAFLAAVRAALQRALTDPSLSEARSTLGLVGAVPFDAADYRIVLDHEREAVRLGYPTLV